MQNAPLAGAAASQKDLSTAKDGSAANFYQAAGLEPAADADAVSVSIDDSGLEPARLKASPDEQKAIDKITQDLGPVVARADAPQLYGVLATLFSRLSAAQQKLFPADAVSINHIYVIDSPVLNAFVHTRKAAGVRRSSNMVFITTGLLKKMLGDDPALLKEGLVRVVGVLSHELAHPLDQFDSEGIGRHTGKAVGGQALEIRADSEGAMIAKEAGYPVESVNESLKRSVADGQAGGLWDSMTRTHPQDDLRLTMQHILLTMDRLETGTHVPVYPEEIPSTILTELSSIDLGETAGRFVAPKDLAEALDRLKNLSSLKRGKTHELLEFNRLVLSTDALLAKKGELDDEDFRIFTEFIRALTAPDAPELVRRDGMKRIFTKDSHSQEFLASPSHEAFMNKVPAYNSRRYLDWARANFFTKSSGYGAAERNLHVLARILPSERVFELFADRLAAALTAGIRTGGRDVYGRDIAKGLSVEFQTRLAIFFHKRVVPQLSEEERIAFFIDTNRGDSSFVFPQTGDSSGTPAQRGLPSRDPRLKSLQADYREVMRTIWDKRGYYGTLDLALAFNNTDWDAVFAVLGIDPKIGRSQLRQAVKQFAKTPAYADVLKTLRDANLASFLSLKLGQPAPKLAELAWLDDTMGPFLEGRFNNALKGSPELGTLARQLFAGAYYRSRPEVFRRAYGDALAKELERRAGKPMSLAELGAAHRDVLDALIGASENPPDFGGTQAEVIDRSDLPAQSKQSLLKAIFLEGHDEAGRVNGLTFDQGGRWLWRSANAAADGELHSIARVLIKNGLAPDVLGIFSRLLARDDFRKANDGYIFYASDVGIFRTELLDGLAKTMSGAASDSEKAAALQVFLDVTIDPNDGDYPNPEFLNDKREIRDMKAQAAALASSLDVPFAARLRLFRRLTGSGATSATDAFFKQRLEPDFDEAAAAAQGLPLSGILESGRIASPVLQLDLTRRVLEPEIERLKSQPQDAEGLNRLIETINTYVGQGSLKKDEYLESLAWRLELSGKELGAFIEDEKSYNWRKANPMLLRFGSALSTEISKLSPKARFEFLAFLIKPEGRELPAPIFKELQRSAYATALAAGSSASHAQLRENADWAADLMKRKIESALIDASPFERIPLIELLLSAGPSALQNSHDFPHDVARTFLHYEPDSTEEKMLDAYLSVSPAHEKTVTLAYLLSQAGENKSSVKNIFEVWQTVGVKFGQLSSIWKLFGEEVARETASLKDNARPMTKAEIEEAMRRELTPEELARVRLKEVIGSASLKTVVLVELSDGREAVMLLRRPHAAEQIESSLRLGQEFLRELDRRGMSGTSAMFDSVLDAVRGQLAEEIQFTKEAESLRTAQGYFEGLNSSMRAQLGDWRFKVPGLIEGFPVRDSILFMEKAEGTTYDKLSPRDRAAAGPLIAESGLSLLFREGWFDADRHTGNQLIDPKTKTIYPLDFGQAAAYSKKRFWQSDDRYELAQFLRALSAGDVEGVLRHGQAMSREKGPADLSALRGKVREILVSGEGGMPDRLIALVSAFTEEGRRLDGKFTFGAFKGLMTLYSERYVGENDFRALISREIASLLKRKLPKTLADDRLDRK